jgi:cyclase
MSLRTRLIPILLLTDRGLVKTKSFKDPVYLGDSLNAVRIFNIKEVDELLVLGIDRSNQNLQPDYRALDKLASECFMPLGYGGGISNLDHAKKVFNIGIEKIVLQSAALSNPKLINQIAGYSGSQSISISIDAHRNTAGEYLIRNSKSGKMMSIEWEQFIGRLEDEGAGEILITSINNEGSMQGYDLQLISKLRKLTKLPLVANGGAGSIDHFVDAIIAGADSVAAGSFFVFYHSRNSVLITYPDYEAFDSKLKGLESLRGN